MSLNSLTEAVSNLFKCAPETAMSLCNLCKIRLFESPETEIFSPMIENRILLVLSGYVRHVSYCNNFSETVLAHFGPGHVFRVEPVGFASGVTETLTCGRVIALETTLSDILPILADDQEFLSAFTCNLFDNQSRFRDRLLEMRTQSVAQRLLGLVERVSDGQAEYTQGKPIQDMSKRDLAALIGATREVTSRNYAKLVSEGLIQGE